MVMYARRIPIVCNGMEWNVIKMENIIFMTFIRIEWNGMECPFKSNIKLLGINHITFRNKYVIFAYVYAIHGISASLPKT